MEQKRPFGGFRNLKQLIFTLFIISLFLLTDIPQNLFCSTHKDSVLCRDEEETVIIPTSGEMGLNGEKGDTGDIGPIGPKGDMGKEGEKGDQGDTGLPGEKGDSGERGLKGSSGEDGEDASIPSFTDGSIIFQSPIGLAENNNALYWDNVNEYLGIGTNTPSFKITSDGDIGPNLDAVYDLGSPTSRWANIYASNIYGEFHTILTPGSIPYVNSLGDLDENNNLLFWNDVSNRLGVGTNSPTALFHVKSLGSGTIFKFTTSDNLDIFSVAQSPIGRSDIAMGDLDESNGLTALYLFDNEQRIKIQALQELILGDAGSYGNGTRFTIEDDNRIGYFEGLGFGIGTTNPQRTLHINSNNTNSTSIALFENTLGDFQIFRIDTTPEGNVTGNIGDLAIDTTNGYLYIKNSGENTNTGWITTGEGTLQSVTDNGNTTTNDIQINNPGFIGEFGVDSNGDYGKFQIFSIDRLSQFGGDSELLLTPEDGLFVNVQGGLASMGLSGLAGNSRLSLANGIGGSVGLNFTNITGNVTQEFQDADGTIALLSDIVANSADNGININSGTIELGGVLNKATSIDANGNSLTIPNLGYFYLSDPAGNAHIEHDGGALSLANGNGVSISVGNGFGLNMVISDDGEDYSFIDLRTITRGIEYYDDYSLGFTSRSLVDKAYVDNALVSSIPTFEQVINKSIATDGYVRGPMLAGEIEDDGGQLMIRAYEGYDMNFGAMNLLTFNFSGGTGDVRVVDNRIIGDRRGIEYYDDYSADFTNRSLVDKSYVDSQILNSTLSAGNGLSINSGTIELGGSLNQQTYIDHNGYDLVIREFAGETSTLFAGDNFKIRDDNNSVEVRFGIGGVDYAGLSFDNPSGSTHNIFTRDKSLEIVSDQNDFAGLIYDKDYSASFIDRSLIDKAYVDNAIISGTNNIYTNDGLLTSKRTLDGNGYSLTIMNDFITWDIQTDVTAIIADDSTNRTRFDVEPPFFQIYTLNQNTFTSSNIVGNASGSLRLSSNSVGGIDNELRMELTSDSLSINTNSLIFPGITYDKDYSANFINRSLVDKEYVDNAITGINHIQKISNVLSPTDSAVYQFQIPNNSANTLTGFKAINTNDVSNYAGAVVELKGSGADYTNNLYFGKYGAGFYIPSWAGNGVMATDKNLVLGALGTTSNMTFQVGGGYSAPTTAMTLDNNGWLGLGTTNPTQKIDVFDTSGEAIQTRNNAVLVKITSEDNWPKLYGETGSLIYEVGVSDQITTDALTLVTNTVHPIIMGTQASEALRIDTNNWIGIGTTTPSAKLDIGGGIVDYLNQTDGLDDVIIAGDLEVDGTILGNITGNLNPGFAEGSIPFQGSSGILEEDNTNLFWDQNNNRLTIGGTNGTAEQTLTVGGDVLIGQYGFISPPGGINRNLYIRAIDGFNPGIQGSVFINFQRNSNNLHRMGVDTSNRLMLQDWNGASWDNNLAISTSGTVGIGTNTPSSTLHLYGADPYLTIEGTNTQQGIEFIGGVYGATLELLNSTGILRLSSDNGLMLYSDKPAGNLGSESILLGTKTFLNPDDEFIQMSDGDTDFMTIMGDGKVGIGTSTPDQALVVIGTIQSSNLLGGAINLMTDTNGNIIRDPSDIRLKENIEDIDSALDKVLKLRGVTYEWIDKDKMGSERDYGLIAQEVYEIEPGLTSTGIDGIMGVKYTNMVALLINAIQELNDKVETMSLGTQSINIFSINNGLISGALIIEDHVAFGEDTVGDIIINQGETKVRVGFLSDYLFTPIITISPEDFVNGAYKITDKSNSEFWIELSEVQDHNVKFNWHAFGKYDGSLNITEEEIDTNIDESVEDTDTNTDIVEEPTEEPAITPESTITPEPIPSEIDAPEIEEVIEPVEPITEEPQEEVVGETNKIDNQIETSIEDSTYQNSNMLE